MSTKNDNKVDTKTPNDRTSKTMQNKNQFKKLTFVNKY